MMAALFVAPLLWAQPNPAASIQPELKQLLLLAGVWKGKATVPATQFREASEAPLKAAFQWVLSGQHLEGDLEYTVGGRPYRARLLLSYDFHARQVVAHWADNFSSKPITYRGRFAGETLALEAAWKEDGRTSRVLLRMSLGPADWTLTTLSDTTGEMIEGVRLTASRSK